MDPFVLTLFMLATLAWAAAQQPGYPPAPSGGQPQAPGAQQQPPTPGSAEQGAAPQSQGQVANAPITEGCLGGSNPNFTITDKAGTIYKLDIAPNADASKLTPHVGESVKVVGDVKGGAQGSSSIEVQSINKGSGNCPGNSQSPPRP